MKSFSPSGRLTPVKAIDDIIMYEVDLCNYEVEPKHISSEPLYFCPALAVNRLH
jgi:hypothetical protein